MKVFIISGLIAVLATGHSALALTLALEPSKDNSIYREQPEHSNALGNIFTGNNANSTTATRRGLLAFDLSIIPPGSSIDSVSLTLYLVQENTGKPALPVALHQLLADWGEGTSNGGGGGDAASVGDATWDRSFFDNTSWTTSGGDFDPSASATTNVGADGTYYTWSSPDMATDVQD